MASSAIAPVTSVSFSSHSCPVPSLSLPGNGCPSLGLGTVMQVQGQQDYTVRPSLKKEEEGGGGEEEEKNVLGLNPINVSVDFTL